MSGRLLGPVVQEAVPDDALLRTYRGGARPEHWGHHGDCFSVTMDRPVNLGDLVVAFYTSRVFRVERLILRLLAGAPSTDAEARAVAEGSGTSFAVWRVGQRTAMGGGFRPLMGFHVVYSRILLNAARRGVVK